MKKYIMNATEVERKISALATSLVEAVKENMGNWAAGAKEEFQEIKSGALSKLVEQFALTAAFESFERSVDEQAEYLVKEINTSKFDLEIDEDASTIAKAYVGLSDDSFFHVTFTILKVRLTDEDVLSSLIEDKVVEDSSTGAHLVRFVHIIDVSTSSNKPADSKAAA